MADQILNRETSWEVCPKCGKKTLKVRTWEEHLKGWGFSSFKVEYYRAAQCHNELCRWSE